MTIAVKFLVNVSFDDTKTSFPFKYESAGSTGNIKSSTKSVNDNGTISFVCVLNTSPELPFKPIGPVGPVFPLSPVLPVLPKSPVGPV